MSTALNAPSRKDTSSTAPAIKEEMRASQAGAGEAHGLGLRRGEDTRREERPRLRLREDGRGKLRLVRLYFWKEIIIMALDSVSGRKIRMRRLPRFLTVLAWIGSATVGMAADEPCTFEGPPVDQARCLLRPVKKFGHLGPAPRSLPAPL